MTVEAFAPDSFTTFGELLKYLRRRERLTQLELSIAVGYSEAQIGRLEKNQRRPDITTLKALFVPGLHLQDEPSLTARFLELAQSARQEDAPAAGLAPYKGLLFFDTVDASLFFGREALTERLAARVARLARQPLGRFLAVVGASGSGKSSLVRAGLTVALNLAGWDTRVFTPTAHPLKRLEAALNSPEGAQPGPMLVIVDQFEEAFTLCHAEDERMAFMDRLLKLASPAPADLAPAQGGTAAVVVVLRADFYSHCAQYPLLRQAVAAQQEYIGQMSGVELRRAIEEPAKRGGWELEPGLVEALLHDIGAQGGGEPEPGALPLLSHALLATWECRRGRLFTLDGYHASGGVRGAIAQTAESVFTDQLNQAQQALARDVFLRLTELGEGTDDTRRRAALTELVRQSEEATQLRAVLNTLAEARLITLNEDSAEVAHEALIREWQRLREWLTQDREGLQLHRHLTESAHEWEAFSRDAGTLYRGAQLAQAREWLPAHAERLNDSERAFVAASVEQEQHDLLEREDQRRRELAAAQELAGEQRRRAEEQAATARQLRQRALFLAGAFVLALLLAGIAFVFGQRASASASAAVAEQRIAQARELAAAAINNLAVDPERSILLALRAVDVSRQAGQPVLVEAADALHRSVESSRVLATLRGHSQGIWALAISGDGSRLATVSQDGTAKIWDAASHQVLRLLATQVTENLSGNGAAFSPAGTELLTVSGQNTATLWDVATGQALMVLSGHTAPVIAVAISGDGRWFATASDDRTVKLWEAATGKEEKTLTGHSESSQVMAFSPDSKRLVAGSDGDGTAIAWDIATGQQLFAFSGQGQVIGVDAIAASPDGTRLATGEFDTTVRVWDAATGEPLLTLFGHSSQIVGVAFSPDGLSLASASEDGTTRLWDAVTGRELLTLAGHASGVLSVVFSPDGNKLYTASRDGTVKIWDVSPTAGSDQQNLAGHTGRIGNVAYSPDGTRLATFGLDGTAKVWDAASGQALLTIPHGDTGCVGGVSFSPDGRHLAVAGGAKPQIYDVDSGTPTLSLAPSSANVCDVAFSPDGKWLAAGSDGGLIRIFDSASGDLLVKFTASPAGIQQITFSPDSQRLATANNDGATVFEAATGQKLLTFKGHGVGVRLSGIAFSPDGLLIATAGNDAAIRVWDSHTGTQVQALTGHSSAAFAVAFSPDGQSLASSSVDHTVKLWSLPSGGGAVAQPLTLYGATAAVYRVAFSPDGMRLATVGRNSVVRLYVLDLERLIAVAQARLTRTLTPAECQTFLHQVDCPAP